MDQPRVFAPWPSAPANNETKILFCTHPKVPTGGTALVQPSFKTAAGALQAGGPAPNEMEAIEITFLRHNKASAANGVRVYAYDTSVDPPVWRETDVPDDDDAPTIGANAMVSVPALTSPQTKRITIVVSNLPGVAVEYTAGADNPEDWNGVIAVHRKRASVGL